MAAQLSSVVTIAVLIASATANASVVSWTGTNGDNKWSTAANWSGNALPAAADEVSFGDAGTATNPSVNLGANRTIDTLTFNTASALTLSSYTLTVTNVNRNDVAGTEGIHTIASTVVLGGNSTWNISGGNYLVASSSTYVNGGSYNFTKTGNGELRLNAGLNTSGTFTVNDGKVTLTAGSGNSIKGAVTVGDGTHAATFDLSQATGQTFSNLSLVTINQGSTLALNTGAGGGTWWYQETTVVNGGTLDIGGGTFNTYNVNTNSILPTLTLTGGTVQNGTLSLIYVATGETTLATLASNKTSLISANLNMNGSVSPIQVARGTAAIDLEVSGQLVGNYGFTKAGDGIMKLSNAAGANFNAGKTPVINVNGGTLLVSNTSGSGTGAGAVNVNSGATLGGTGIITGSAANVKLTGLSGQFARIAPGDIDSATGAAILGTLTVGSSTQANSVTFSNFSALASQVGSAGAADLLAVFGNISLATADDYLLLSTFSGSPLDGTYVLATFTGTLTGRFDHVTLDGAALDPAYTLEYLDANGNVVTGTGAISGGSVVLVAPAAPVPEPLSLGILAVAGLATLARRR